jgi:CheY-like chemotaxis protein
MFPDAKPGPYLLVRVTDTGTGIPAEVLERIFDPFFTTKPPGKGTGLGLSTVLGILRSHGGFMDLKSELGSGTTFAIYFPASPAITPTVADPFPDPSQAHAGHGETVLVVDDELQILDVTKKTLEKHGYHVFVAEDGVAAMACFRQHHREIQAVLTDLDMPSLDGVGLVRALRTIDPATPVGVCSGIGSERSLEEKKAVLRQLGVETFLSKPYAAPTLINALQDILRTSEPTCSAACAEPNVSSSNRLVQTS